MQFPKVHRSIGDSHCLDLFVFGSLRQLLDLIRVVGCRDNTSAIVRVEEVTRRPFWRLNGVVSGLLNSDFVLLSSRSRKVGNYLGSHVLQNGRRGCPQKGSLDSDENTKLEMARERPWLRETPKSDCKHFTNTTRSLYHVMNRNIRPRGAQNLSFPVKHWTMTSWNGPHENYRNTYGSRWAKRKVI